MPSSMLQFQAGCGSKVFPAVDTARDFVATLSPRIWLQAAMLASRTASAILDPVFIELSPTI
jgi:hypothetical protein